MKEVRGVIENYILNHDRNKRLLALFLALAILVSFAVPASLIQPANSMTANSDGGATLLSDDTDRPTPTVSETITAPNASGKPFTSACTYIPLKSESIEGYISTVTVVYSEPSDDAEPIYDEITNEIIGYTYPPVDTDGDGIADSISIPAGADESTEFELKITYKLPPSYTANSLSTNDPCMYYILPENFTVLEDLYGSLVYVLDEEYNRDLPAAYFSVDDDTGLVVIQFTDEYIQYLKDNGTTATGTLVISGSMGRADTADGDSSIELGGFTITSEFEDKPNSVTKSQGTVAPNANGGADVTWSVTVYDGGYGFTGWSVKDANFVGASVIMNPEGQFGTWNGDTYTFTSEPGVSSVTFTYTKTLSVAEIEALYDANNLTVTNRVDITNPDGLTDSAESSASLERPSVEKVGTADYETGSYGNVINWEITVTNPYGGPLNEYVVSDTYLSQQSATLVVKDAQGNVLTSGTDYTYNSGNDLTLTTNKSEVIISYQTQGWGGNTYTNNAVLKDGSTQISNDSETVTYENATHLGKQGVYDPETNTIVWFVTAESHIGFLDGYKIYDRGVFGPGFAITSLEQIDIISVDGMNGTTVYSDLTAVENSDGSITYKDSNGTVYGTVSFVADDTSNSVVQIVSADSTNKVGITKVEFSFSTPVVEGQTEYSNTVEPESGQGDTAKVTPSCQYNIDKSGSYNAANGTIEWTISVKNNTALDTASLNDVTLTDAALVGMSASDLALSWAMDTSGNYDFTLSSSGNVVTITDANGNAVATLTIDSAAGTITFSSVTAGFNDIGLKYTKTVSQELIKQAASQTTTVSNTLSAEVPGDNPTDVSETVTVTNPYSITKTGSYDASTGNIIWTVEVQNTSGTLSDIELTDDAFGNLASGTGIEISQAHGYYNVWNVTAQGSDNSFTFTNNGTSYGTMALSDGKITFTDSGDNGLQYVKFTYQTKATAGNNESETNTISSNKLPDVTSDPVTVTNPYTMSKSAVGEYNPETGLVTWSVVVKDTSWNSLDGVVLADTQFNNLVSVWGDYAYFYYSWGESVSLSSKTQDNVITIYKSQNCSYNGSWGTYDVPYATLTFADGKVAIDVIDAKALGYGVDTDLDEVKFSYQTKVTQEDIANGYVTNTIGTHGTGVGPSEGSSATHQITNREVLFDKYSTTNDVETHGDGEATYTPAWTINIRKDDGYSSDEPILVDVLSADNGGKHYITAAQLSAIKVSAKQYEADSSYTLLESGYTIVGTGEVTDDNGTVLGYSGFTVTFNDSVDTANYRYLQITYNTSANTSGVVGQGSGTTATFTNSATFDSDKSDGDNFTYTEIPEDYVETISLNVNKTWSDGGSTALRTDVQFKLLQKIGSNGEWTYYDSDDEGDEADIFTISSNGSDTWTYTINNLPKTTPYSEYGQENIYYKVEEITEISGYKTTYVGNYDNGTNSNGAVIQIINTLVSVEVEKKWVNNNPDGTLNPVSVTLQYSADNGSTWNDYTNGTIELSGSNNWTYKWTALDPDYIYRVNELAVDGYTTTYSATSVDGVNNQKITITNTSNNITVNKNWVDVDGYRPASGTVTVGLYKIVGDSEELVGELKPLDGSDYQTLTWYGLESGAEYFVEEIGADGYVVTYKNASGQETQNVKSGGTINITNTLVSVYVEKSWSGYQSGTTPPDVEVKLQYKAKDAENIEANWNDYTVDGTVCTATLSYANSSLKAAWHNLNPDYVYRVVEVNTLSGYTVSYSEDYIDGVTDQYFNIYNTSNNISVYKLWSDDQTNRPTNVEVGLYKIVDGEEELVSTQILTGTYGQTLTWYGLEPNYQYIVREADIEGYVTTYKNSSGTATQNATIGDTITITNTKNNIKISKVWKDLNGNTITPDIDSIKLDVYQSQSGVPAISDSVTDRTTYTGEDGSVTGAFALPDLQAGDKLTLRINSNQGYIQYCNGCIGANDAAGNWVQLEWNGTINSYYLDLTFDVTQDLTNVVFQTWYNGSSQNGSPDYIDSVDYSIQSWTLYDTITVTPDDNGNWTYNLTNLPTGTAPGEYIYKFVEQTVDGYYATYTNNDGVTPTSNSQVTITNNEAETVDKVAYDKDGNAIVSGSLIKPNSLEKATIDGVECYVIHYQITPCKSGLKIIDTLPTGWSFCTSAPYNPVGYWDQWNIYSLSSGTGENNYQYDNTSTPHTVTFYNAKWSHVDYYISIPVETLDNKIKESNSVLVENTAALESENSQPTTNRIVVSNSTSGNNDDSLIDKTASINKAGDLKYTVVFNPEGKNLANGDEVHLTDDFNLLDCVNANGVAFLDQADVKLSSFTVERADSITYDSNGNLVFDENGILDYEGTVINAYYTPTYEPTETTVTVLEFATSTYYEYNMWETSDFEIGDQITFVVSATDKANSSWGETGPYIMADEWNNGYYTKLVDFTEKASYNSETKQWTYTYTVDKDYAKLAIGSYNYNSGEYNWANSYVTDVSATTSTTTQLSTVTLDITVPDETPIVITYYYTISPLPNGSTVTASNSISFDTGNYNGSDTNDATEFLVNKTSSTISVATAPTIKKVSISDYSVKVDAEFKMAYWDGVNNCWVFAVAQEKGEGNIVKPVWTTTDGATATATDNTIPSNAHSFELGTIDISLEDGKLYKLIETSMPFGYHGYNLAADFNATYNYTGSETDYDGNMEGKPNYAAYITAVKDSMAAAARTEAIFEDLLQGYLAGYANPYSAFFTEFEPVYYFAYEDADYATPSGFAEQVTTVATTGELILNNSEMIEITIDKTWDQTAIDEVGVEVTDVKSIVKLYWSTVKKSTGFPEQLYEVNDTYFSSLKDVEGFQNPQVVGTADDPNTEEIESVTAKWGLLPSGYMGQPIYYYVKEIGYMVGTKTYYYLESADEYVYARLDDQGNIIPLAEDGTDLSGTDYVTVGIKPIYTGNGTNNNPNWVDTSKNKQVEIDIQNTAGLKIEKLWRTSDNKDFFDPEVNMKPPLDSVPIILYGTLASTGIEQMIGSFTVGTANDWHLIIDEKEYNLSAYKSFRVEENVPADQQHLIYGYAVSYGYNVNGTSGTITVTNKDNTPTEIDVTVNKVWSDSADHTNDSVTLQLYQTTRKEALTYEEGDTLIIEEITLSQTNNWTYTTTEKLPYKDSVSGLRYYYYVVEKSYNVENGETYKTNYTRSDIANRQTLTVTNYVPGSINIEKNWIDTNNATIPSNSLLLPDGIQVDIYRRPDEVMYGEGGATLDPGIQVYADGDSITNGFWTGADPYPNVLEGKLPSTTDEPANVVNSGVSSQLIDTVFTTYNDKDLSDADIKFSTGYNFYTVIAGTNDINYGHSIDEIVEDYTTLILDKVKAVDSNVVVLVGGIPHEDFWDEAESETTTGFSYTGALQYVVDNYPTDTSNQTQVEAYEKTVNKRIDDANARIKALVESYQGLKIYYVDIPAVLDALVEEGKEPLHDGCHPSQAGYNAIALAFYDAINTYYGVGTMETPKNMESGYPEDITDTTKYEYVGTYTIDKPDTEDGTWTTSIELPTMNDSNVNYVYYVVEKTTGYTVAYNSNGQVIGDNDGDTISVTNTVDTEKTSITVEKLWRDNDSGNRPSSVELQLQRKLENASGWTDIGEKFTLTSEGGWTTTITDLDVTNNNGVKYHYQVVETVPDGYIVTYGDTNGDAAAVAGTTITVTNTKTFDLTVKKVWSDPDHVLNEGVQVEIYRDIVNNTGGNGLNIMPLQLALVTPADGNLAITTGKTATVEVNKANTTVSFSEDLATAVVNDKTITVTARDTTGNTVMTITDADGQTVKVNITVTDKPTLTLALSQSSILAGETSTISAELSDGTAIESISYEITGTAATLSGNTLTGVNAGTVTVKATATVGDDTYEATTTLTVNLTDSFTLTATENADGTFTVTPSPSYGTFVYTSSNDSIATVDKNTGVVTIHGAGTVTITATRNGEDTASVDIKVPLTVSPESVTMSTSGSTSTQELTVNSTDVTYESSDETVATVSDDGVITAKGDGSATITVYYHKGQADEQSKTVNVTVSSGPLATVGSSGYTLNLDSSKTVESVSVTFGDMGSDLSANMYQGGTEKAYAWLDYDNGTLSYTTWGNTFHYSQSVSGNTLLFERGSNEAIALDKLQISLQNGSSSWEIETIVVTYSDGTVVTHSAAGSTSSGGGGSGGEVVEETFPITLGTVNKGDTVKVVLTGPASKYVNGALSGNVNGTWTNQSWESTFDSSGNLVLEIVSEYDFTDAQLQKWWCSSDGSTSDLIDEVQAVSYEIIPAGNSGNTGGGDEPVGDTVTGNDLNVGTNPSVAIDSSKTVTTLTLTLSDDTVNGSYSNFAVYIGNYLAGANIASQNGTITVSQEWGGCTYTVTGNTVTLTLNKSADAIIFANYGGSNVVSSYTITYASTAAASYSLLNRVSYAPPSRAYALLADATYPELVDTVLITSTEDWTYIYENLPVYDSNGNPYYYWIVEVGANGFTPSYSFSDGDDVAIDADYCINAENAGNATATVKNTPNDTSTSLPSTGGQGTQRYYVTGIAIMLCALAGIYGFKRRQRSQS
ncbi:MAG: Cna B-type domain-containing protein [Oscillospiraceae bacterium]|nr:Cna B-type domain-containing protein [Oscillospiraceae bacterium]